MSHVLPQGRNEDSFLNKYKSFVHRKKSYMDYRSDIRDGLTCLYDCISISFWDIQISWWEVCFASGIYCLPAHRKGWVVRTEGNTIFIDSIVNPFDGKRCFQRNKSFLESDFLKEGFVDFDGVKGCVSKKSLRFNKRMFPEKSIKTGSRAFESARDLSSSGESDFFSTTISGCAFKNSLL